jgi:hypothetical protein
MKRSNIAAGIVVLLSLDFGASACSASVGTVSEGVLPDNAALQTFEEFRRGALQESTGEYVVDGDVVLETDVQLKQFFDAQSEAGETVTVQQELAVMTSNGRAVLWSAAQAKNLTYCLSPDFGWSRSEVATALDAASEDWMRVANVRLLHMAAEDARCSRSNPRVLFNVEPVDVQGRYLARSFFPVTPRASRNIKIDVTALGRQRLPRLSGILRHELGHVLGFRHEHTRPEAGACFEDENWAALTSYDQHSVMHYPQCRGGGNPELRLSPLDIRGAQKAYPF